MDKETLELKIAQFERMKEASEDESEISFCERKLKALRSELELLKAPKELKPKKVKKVEPNNNVEYVDPDDCIRKKIKSRKKLTDSFTAF